NRQQQPPPSQTQISISRDKRLSFRYRFKHNSSSPRRHRRSLSYGFHLTNFDVELNIRDIYDQGRESGMEGFGKKQLFIV
ncbi:hypothetical protein LINPERPRIM_LOCUS27361, partial [Linum perenne]